MTPEELRKSEYFIDATNLDAVYVPTIGTIIETKDAFYRKFGPADFRKILDK